MLRLLRRIFREVRTTEEAVEPLPLWSDTDQRPMWARPPSAADDGAISGGSAGAISGASSGAAARPVSAPAERQRRLLVERHVAVRPRIVLLEK
eukprot:scaffold19514_cov103-Isochrysis_galbana.AAC.1